MLHFYFCGHPNIHVGSGSGTFEPITCYSCSSVLIMCKITVYQIQLTAYQISLKVYNIVKTIVFIKLL